MPPPIETAASTVKNIKEWILTAANDVQQRAEHFRHHNGGSSSSPTYDFSPDDIGLLPVLPSRQDRMLVLHAVMAAADHVEKERTELRKKVAANAVETTVMKAQRERYRQRLNQVLQEQLVPAAASSLLLCKQIPKPDEKDSKKKGGDGKKDPMVEMNEAMKEAQALQEMCQVMANASTLNPRQHLIQDPYECMVLLISNLVLRYGESHGGYDARVRHVVQRACVSILMDWMDRMLALEQSGNMAMITNEDGEEEPLYHPQLQDLIVAAMKTKTIFEYHEEKGGTTNKPEEGKAEEPETEDATNDKAEAATTTELAIGTGDEVTEATPAAESNSPDDHDVVATTEDDDATAVSEITRDDDILDALPDATTPISPNSASAAFMAQSDDDDSGFGVPMDPSGVPIPSAPFGMEEPPIQPFTLPTSHTDSGLSPPATSSNANMALSAQEEPKEAAKAEPKPPALNLSKREQRKWLKQLATRKFLAMEQTIAGKMAALLLSNFQPQDTVKRAHHPSSEPQFNSSASVPSDDVRAFSTSSFDEVEDVTPAFSSSSAAKVDKIDDSQTSNANLAEDGTPAEENAAANLKQAPTSSSTALRTNLSGGMNPTLHNFNKMKETMAVVAKKQKEQMGLMLLKNKKQIIRGLQITGVGAVAGTIFALTGGLAAPAIAAWIAGFGIATGTTASAVVAVVTTSQVVATIFGLGGGGLAAYKMKKRTAGLREFRLRREQIEQTTYMAASDEILKLGIQASLPQLHTTICISGWIQNMSDFQRPWGIQPTDPPIYNAPYLLRRFFTVHDPPRVATIYKEIKQRQKEERKSFSWEVVFGELERKYGKDPRHLLPLDISKEQNEQHVLSKTHQTMVSELLEKIVLSKIYVNHMDMIDEKESVGPVESPNNEVSPDDESSIASSYVTGTEVSCVDDASLATTTDGTEVSGLEQNALEGVAGAAAAAAGGNNTKGGGLQASDFSWSDEKGSASLKKLQAEVQQKDRQRQTEEWAEQQLLEAAAKQNTSSPNELTDIEEGGENSKEENAKKGSSPDCIVWDWHAQVGGDLHTLTWESQVLSGLSHIVETMATEVTSQTTKQVLGATAVGAIFAAVAIPSALLTASQLIDDPYQIVILRADEAGIELARCLLLSQERRPVSLIGYSFGARVIFTCLTELARHQELWEYQQSLTPQELRKYKRDNRHKLLNGDNEILDYVREPASIVQDVIVMGLPRTMEAQAIATARYMAGGNFVNCYSRKDWLLSLMFLARAGTQTCGTHPIDNIPGIENYNVTDLVEAHAKYGDAVPKILKRIGPMC
eukprot:CAMPEP_0119557630 /NCGR_PEP_ID=MMETSP1352-20130426/9239_1 /TAXON_ID=265584 /ORGANISM="Stauroneis constricta, Strain CCMP1120" /LENGTH=1297 /DNA_ID=CAMNT_0007604767 /DNA_START=274 /DNA_END=4167 /DNA_ORIENTATION=+